MASSRSSKQSKGNIFDVARPNHSTPAATSRPVITRQSSEPDPMVTPKETRSPKPEKHVASSEMYPMPLAAKPKVHHERKEEPTLPYEADKFVVMSTTERSALRHLRWIAILCLIIVVVVVADLLLDKDRITIPGLPHTHLFGIH